MLVTPRSHGSRHAEVGDERVAVPREQQVLRLDVAVDHVLAVGVLEGLGRLAGDAERILQRQLPLPPKAVPQALALDVRHGEPEPAGGLAGVEDREDVRVLEPGGEPDLALEPLRAHGGGELRVEHLQGYGPVVLEVAGKVDRGHAPAAELPLERVTVLQRFTERRERIWHQPRVFGRGRAKDTVRTKGGESRPGSPLTATRSPAARRPDGSGSARSGDRS